MVEFDSFINVDKLIEAKDSNYITKELTFDNKRILNTPYKVFNVSKVKLNKLQLPIKGSIVESTKFINNKRSYDALYNLLENTSNNQKSKLNQFFKVDNTFKSYNSVISLTFSKNPFKSNKFARGKSEALSFSNFEYLLDYMYEYSTLFVLVPDIDFKGEFIEDYMDYIEEAVNIVSSFNNKPIFVPLSMKLDNTALEKLLIFYKKNNYSNIWFNFYSNQINTKISNIRYSLRLIERLFKGTAVTYFSNMKKEINKHLDDVYTLPSDFLGPFFGCDFLGSNRESGFSGKNNIKRTDKEKIEFKRKNLINQNRIFDPSSYYYYSILEHPFNSNWNPEIILKNNGLSDIINSNILSQELSIINKHVIENKNIGKYLKNKKMFRDNTKLKDDLLIIDENQSSLSDFFSKL